MVPKGPGEPVEPRNSSAPLSPWQKLPPTFLSVLFSSPALWPRRNMGKSLVPMRRRGTYLRAGSLGQTKEESLVRKRLLNIP